MGQISYLTSPGAPIGYDHAVRELVGYDHAVRELIGYDHAVREPIARSKSRAGNIRRQGRWALCIAVFAKDCVTGGQKNRSTGNMPQAPLCQGSFGLAPARPQTV